MNRVLLPTVASTARRWVKSTLLYASSIFLNSFIGRHAFILRLSKEFRLPLLIWLVIFRCFVKGRGHVGCLDGGVFVTPGGTDIG